MTAAFSPMAIAVLYVFDETFSGIMLMSFETINYFQHSGEDKRLHTCNFEVLDAIYIEPFVNYSTLIAGLHGTGPALQRKCLGQMIKLFLKRSTKHTECQAVTAKIE